MGLGLQLLGHRPEGFLVPLSVRDVQEGQHRFLRPRQHGDCRVDVPDAPLPVRVSKLVVPRRRIRVEPAQAVIPQHTVQILFPDEFRPAFLPLDLACLVARLRREFPVDHGYGRVLLDDHHRRRRRLEDRAVHAFRSLELILHALHVRDVDRGADPLTDAPVILEEGDAADQPVPVHPILSAYPVLGLVGAPGCDGLAPFPQGTFPVIRVNRVCPSRTPDFLLALTRECPPRGEILDQFPGGIGRPAQLPGQLDVGAVALLTDPESLRGLPALGDVLDHLDRRHDAAPGVRNGRRDDSVVPDGFSRRRVGDGLVDPAVPERANGGTVVADVLSRRVVERLVAQGRRSRVHAGEPFPHLAVQGQDPHLRVDHGHADADVLDDVAVLLLGLLQLEHEPLHGSAGSGGGCPPIALRLRSRLCPFGFLPLRHDVHVLDGCGFIVSGAAWNGDEIPVRARPAQLRSGGLR